MPLGKTYATAITSSKSISVAPNASHAVPSEISGAQQVYAELSQGCVLHH